MRAPWICLALLSGFAMSAGARAADPDPTVLRVTLQNPVGGAPQASRQIALSGTAPARCAPTLGHVTLDGNDLSIELTSPRTACDGQHTQAFGLRIDPGASAGLPILPGQVYRVRVYATNANASTLIAFSLLDTTATAAAVTPENGFWWSEASADTGAAATGNGASIEFQDGQLALGLFGFDDAGASTWYFGSARAGGRIARVPLVQLANGDPMFAPSGAQPTAQAGPRVELEFLSPTRARAYLVRSEDGRDTQVRSLVLSRAHFSNGPLSATWSGQWVFVPDDGDPPRLFEFADPGSRDADTFHLADNANDASLDCRLAAGAQNPDVCTLSVGSVSLADFDQIGLDHLGGHGINGARVKLVRVPR